MTIPLARFSKKTTARIFLIALTILVVGCTAPTSEEQDKNWTRAEDLINNSDRVLSVRFIQAHVETVPRIDRTTGASTGDIDVLFRQFEVIDAFKGTSDPEDLLWVAFEPGPTGELVDGQGQVLDFRDGPTYVVFLKGRLRPLEYPTDFGPVLWTGNGEPSFAELNGQQLLFRAERAFVSQIAQNPLPVTLSASPFELTLAEIETMTR